MRSEHEHRWNELDDLVAFYFSRYGEQREWADAAEALGIGLGSMKMRISNFRSQENPGGLANASKQTCAVFQSYRHLPEPELRAMVLGVLMRARDVGHH